jgi:hypothetical protein
MTPDDELERELEALQPRPPSPELRWRISRRLNRRTWLTVAAGGAIAASVVGAFVLSRHEIGDPPMVPPRVAAVEPSVLAYGRAAAKSSEALDDMLDKQAVRSGWSEPRLGAASYSLDLRGLHE